MTVKLMQKLFVDYAFEDKIILDEEQSRHIAKSLRMKKGDMVTVCDGAGTDYGCIIDEITKDSVTLSVCYKQASSSEPSIKVSLYQEFPRVIKWRILFRNVLSLAFMK